MVSLKALNGKSWKTALLLSIVVPVSLLATLRLTGIIKEPITPQNIILDALIWNFQRPSDQYVIIGDTMEYAYSNRGLSASFYMQIIDYIPRTGSFNYDALRIVFKINATITNSSGFTEYVHVVARKDQESLIDWLENDFCFDNLSMIALTDAYRWDTEAYFKLADVNHTQDIYAETTALWELLTLNTQSYQLEITYEITYYNGTAYNRVVQPFQLNLIGRE